VRELLRSLSNGRVLDVGVGTGRNSELARSLRHEVYGFDVSAKMLEKAAERLHLETESPFLRLGDVRRIPFGDRFFDCMLCCRVLSHLEELELALNEMHRVLRKGGALLVTDVDGRHKYDATRIPVEGKNVWIRVYKHRLEDVAQAATKAGFRVNEERLLYASDLAWKPREGDFPTIDWTSKVPVSYRLVLQRAND